MSCENELSSNEPSPAVSNQIFTISHDLKSHDERDERNGD